MSLQRSILLDLVPGQATASAVAEHLGISGEAALDTLRSLHGADLVEPVAVSILTAWRLTDKARQLHADSIR